MEDKEKERRKEEKRKKTEEHRKWLEQMKLKQNVLSKQMSGKRIEKLKDNIMKRVEKEICKDIEEELKLDRKNSDEEKAVQTEIQSERQRQRLFAKHLNLTASYSKTTLEISLEKKLSVAVSRGDFHEVERLNRVIYNIHISQAVKDASAKAQFELNQMNDATNPKPMLDWKFNRKTRWERKGNS